jgi:hypothetical protein
MVLLIKYIYFSDSICLVFMSKTLRNESRVVKNGVYLCVPTKGSFDVYTSIPTVNLLKTGYLMSDNGGEIRIYQRSWMWN